MKSTISTLLVLFGISLFTGIIIVAIGFGAAFPVISRIAAPVVCNGRDMQLSTDTYSYRPGESSTTITWYCVDPKTGVKLDISFQTILASGLIYSLLIFAVLVIRLSVGSGSEKTPALAARPSGQAPAVRSNQDPEAAWKRLEELKRLRASDLISEAEYERKKAEILKTV